MSKYKLFASVLVLIIIAASPTALLAMDGTKSGDHDCKAAWMKDLTSEQRDKMEKLMLKHKHEMIDLEADIKKVRLKIKEEFMTDSPDRKTLESLVDKLAATKGKIHKNKIGLMLDAKKILPDEHWKLFVKKHMEMGHCMHGYHKPRIKGGCGSHHGMCERAAGCAPASKPKCMKGAG